MAPIRIPPFKLSHGQLVWTLCRGEVLPEPQHQRLLNEVRYLRQLGVPFKEKKRGKGRGHPIRYGYEDLVELAVGLAALRRGIQPHLVADFLVTNRKALSTGYREALEEQPAPAVEAEWLGSRGKIVPFLANERFLRLHNRYSETPGKYELIRPREAETFEDSLGMREVFADGTAPVLIPLTRLVLEMTYWARQAPEVRPGRRKKAERGGRSAR